MIASRRATGPSQLAASPAGALIVAALCASQLAAGRASAAVVELVPTAALGGTDNAVGASSTGAVQSRDFFTWVGVAGRLRLTRARSAHSFGYGVRRTWYFGATAADNTAHDAFWSSNLTLSARTELVVGATVSYFTLSSVATPNPVTTDPTLVPVGTAPSGILTASTSETLSYAPNGRDRLTEALSVSYIRAADAASGVPTLMQLNLNTRAQRMSGRNIWSTTLIATDFFRLTDPPGATSSASNGHFLAFQALGGFGREISPALSFELQAGALLFYDTSSGGGAVGPGGTASVSYRHIPWYATLTATQQPTINLYIGEAVIADSLNARLALPLNQRETLLVAGVGGYTYARRIDNSHHFLLAPRAYDLLMVGGSVIYRFERLPLVASADYSATTLHGSLSDGRFYPSTLRRIFTISLSGAFAWGEGNFGIPRAARP